MLESLLRERPPPAVLGALRAYPDVVLALDGIIEEWDRLGYPPTTRLIYGRVVLGRLRKAEYESAPLSRAAETPEERALGPEKAGAEHHTQHKPITSQSTRSPR